MGAGNPAATLFLGNLHERVDERLLLELMAQAGPVADVHIPRDRETRRHRGYAFAEYETEESARYALGLFSAQPIYLYHRLVRFMASPSLPTTAGRHSFNLPSLMSGADKQRRQVPTSPYDMGQLDGGFLDPTRQQACLPLPLQFLPAYGAPSPYTTAPTSFAGRGYDVATGQSGQSHLDNPRAGADGGPLLPSPLQTT
eukprot:SM000028S10204  [mRNA]  locus=s28:899414:901041:+ [translate_table: standard]